MKTKQKNDFVMDISQLIAENIKASKALKYSSMFVAISIGVVAIGYGAKILNFSISNIKTLSKTIKGN